MRLEGWVQGMDSQPSFETPRKSAAPQDEVGDRFTSSQDEVRRANPKVIGFMKSMP
jgi:hypothetical protein